jgi:DNA polymerase-3 subunit delta'
MVPDPFSPLVGQPQAVELLTCAIAQERIAPAYLFAGPNGIGRSLAARCFLELLVTTGATAATEKQRQQRLRQGNHPDVLWVEPTYLHQGKRLTVSEMSVTDTQRLRSRPQIRLEQIRDIARFLSRPPLEASRSVVAIEQAETMGEAAANGLLKTLEEPGQATLILIAPSAGVLLPTLVSRCQQIPFTRLTIAQTCQVLERTGYSEILDQAQILAMAQGSPGAAINSWQQRQSIPPELLQAVSQLPQSPRDALERAQQIDQTLDTEAQLWLVDYLQQCYWQEQRQPHLLHHLEQARQYLLGYAQPQLVWEVTLLAMCQSNSFEL